MNTNNKIQIKHQYLNTYRAKCPKCGTECTWLDDTDIEVNCYSKRKVEIKNMIAPYKSVCRNPLCEWSKVTFDDEKE